MLVNLTRRMGYLGQGWPIQCGDGAPGLSESRDLAEEVHTIAIRKRANGEPSFRLRWVLGNAIGLGGASSSGRPVHATSRDVYRDTCAPWTRTRWGCKNARERLR